MTIKNPDLFRAYCIGAGMTGEEIKIFWSGVNPDLIDYVERLCEYTYSEGYKACQEDSM